MRQLNKEEQEGQLDDAQDMQAQQLQSQDNMTKRAGPDQVVYVCVCVCVTVTEYLF